MFSQDVLNVPFRRYQWLTWKEKLQWLVTREKEKKLNRTKAQNLTYFASK